MMCPSTPLPTEIRRRVQRAMKIRDFRGALRSTSGAIDLASIVVGVIVIGVIAGVFAATVFAVIPWSQNAAAKQSLDAVRTAEGMTRVQDNRYTDMAGLTAASRIQASTKVSVSTDAAGTCYVGVSKSATGKVFYITDAGPDVKELTAATVLSCTIVGGIDLLVTGVGGPDPAAAPLPDQFAKLTTYVSPAGAQNWTGVATSADGQKIIAATCKGCGGYLYTSTDGAATVTPNIAAGIHNWASVTSSADGTRLMAADQGGYIYMSSDSGATWAPNLAAGNRNWQMITSTPDGTRLAGTSEVGLVMSSDSGATWTTGVGTAAKLSSVTMSDDGKNMAGAGVYVLYTSTDYGVTWTPRYGASSAYRVAGSGDGKVLVVGLGSGDFRISHDFGVTWTLYSSSVNLGVAVSADGTKIVTTSNSGVYTSADSGLTWKLTQTVIGDYAVTITRDGKKIIGAPQNRPIYVLTYGPQ